MGRRFSVYTEMTHYSTHLLLNPNNPDGTWDELFMIAGGTGVTPMLQLIKYYLRVVATQHDRKISMNLLYANKSVEAIINGMELEGYAATSGGMLTICYVLENAPEKNWKGLSGRISTAMLRSWITYHQQARSQRTTIRPTETGFAEYYDDTSKLPQQEYGTRYDPDRMSAALADLTIRMDNESPTTVINNVMTTASATAGRRATNDASSLASISASLRDGSTPMISATGMRETMTPGMQQPIPSTAAFDTPTRSPQSTSFIYDYRIPQFKIVACGPRKMLESVSNALKEIGYLDNDYIIMW
jgi:hypothetical protein